MISNPVMERGVHVLLLTAALAFPAMPLARSQPVSWHPEKTVELVIPAAPGGAIDGTVRLMQRVLQFHRMINTPVVAVNKGGGGGNIAISYLHQHAGDGHYVLASTMSLMPHHILGRAATTYSDYTPLATLFSETMTLVVKADSPINTARDIKERLKADPQSLSIATDDWKKEMERIQATSAYTSSKQSAQLMPLHYVQLKTAVVEAGLAKELNIKSF